MGGWNHTMAMGGPRLSRESCPSAWNIVVGELEEDLVLPNILTLSDLAMEKLMSSCSVRPWLRISWLVAGWVRQWG